MKFFFQNLLFTFFLLLFAAYPMDATASGEEPLDYAIASNWISGPDVNISHDVDLFYVYPTVYFSNEPDNMSIDDKDLLSQAKGVFTEHSGVYAKSANLFAPYYRQVSIAVMSLSGEKFDHYFSKAYADVRTAFLYYLSHNNNGRPFILAGHSQGSDMILELMKELFHEPARMDKLVAAYIIGYSVTKKDLEQSPWLKIAQTATDVGCIITYNTQSKDATGSPVLLPGAQCVNPLTWSTHGDRADDTLNKGAVFFNEKHEITKEIPHYTAAYIASDGALIAPDPTPEDFHSAASFFPLGVYHAYDYSFFYRNLEENVAERIKAYQEQK